MYFCDQSCIFSIITPVFSVTWSSEIIIICCSRNISDYYQWWKQLYCWIFLWKLIQDSLMNRRFKRTTFIWNRNGHIINILLSHLINLMCPFWIKVLLYTVYIYKKTEPKLLNCRFFIYWLILFIYLFVKYNVFKMFSMCKETIIMLFTWRLNDTTFSVINWFYKNHTKPIWIQTLLCF